ncbi:protein RL9A [Panine betaherpesvirus 2]|uniref:Protein RL9A n=1 Tax=Panine betaherpesvirus 2 TaxID=188763 RepID=G9VYW5_9BETA|nr:protein RL9A [Panine betaherpesvirus 2]AEV81011.1 protein RL9A [Panine betaherpesvirus 2]QXV67751.1 protein RL9A [Panine betaherpesvirus 2]
MPWSCRCFSAVMTVNERPEAARPVAAAVAAAPLRDPDRPLWDPDLARVILSLMIIITGLAVALWIFTYVIFL